MENEREPTYTGMQRDCMAGAPGSGLLPRFVLIFLVRERLLHRVRVLLVNALLRINRISG
jgi:hypothetical protein